MPILPLDGARGDFGINVRDMPKSIIVRVAQENDYDAIRGHLLVVGELSGDCYACRHVGIDVSREKYCPSCKTDFRYIASRRSPEANTPAVMGRLLRKRPDLTYVEFEDVKDVTDHLKARDLFK
jgi:hypothetical protein